MIFKDYYKILELETNKVTIDEIKVAYRSAAKKYHPDVNVGDRLAEERIKDINEAYRVLSNSSTKRKYDRMWNANVGKKRKAFEESGRDSNSIFSDFFNMYFGNIENKRKDNKREPVRGENIETEIQMSLEEAFFGKKKTISLRTVEGKMKVFTVTIPAGIRNGEKIRLVGQGRNGENGGKNGDLFIKINIEDNQKFKLNGYDLYTDLLLTPWEAALGTKATLKSIDEETQVYIPKGMQSGETIKIQGKGYKDGKGGRGDLVAEIKVMVPKDLSKEEEKIYEKLKSVSNFNPRSI